VARSRHIIHVELSRLLQLYSYLEFKAKCLLGELIHRRGVEVDFALARQDMARCEMTPSQSGAGEMEVPADERFDESPIRRVSQSPGRRE
jgi:hypothetical protein